MFYVQKLETNILLLTMKFITQKSIKLDEGLVQKKVHSSEGIHKLTEILGKF